MPLKLEESERFKFHTLTLNEKKAIIKKLKEMLSGYKEIVLALIYGSILKNTPLRDIDVAIYIYGDIDFLDYKFKLDKKLTEKSGYPVDVKILNNAPPWFILEVLETGKVLINRNTLLIEKLYSKALDENWLIQNDSIHQ
ncbi:MAG: nucleotidyltransferase domain-containing protein [archaeon GB-1867-035]|mgnify:CR=1 FL=1|nr:nucleotidyltransferase domain-containing protein [Candidatus Culexmicrobium profundum]